MGQWPRTLYVDALQGTPDNLDHPIGMPPYRVGTNFPHEMLGIPADEGIPRGLVAWQRC